MGYGIHLRYKYGNAVQVERLREGGTYSPDGTTDAKVSITFNYAKFYRQTIDESEGIRWLYGKKASECVSRLHGAIRELGTVQDADYWKATPGNAGHALSILLKWAKQHPDAVFGGD